MPFDWSHSAATLKGFGGEPVTFSVRKSGLPFFDALQLYGAIDLYIGVREDVSISDQGDSWSVIGRRRATFIVGKDESAFANVIGPKASAKRKARARSYCASLRNLVFEALPIDGDPQVNALVTLSGLDSTLRTGLRGIAASHYDGLKSGSSDSLCVARISLSAGLLAFAGRRRVESFGEITFLPIFHGTIDLSKVLSPLRLWVTVPNIPNVLCAQVLVLLALKSSLFAEGYQDRLSQVVFDTNLYGQRSDNYSGIVSVGSTAIGQLKRHEFVGRLYRAFRDLVRSAWKRRGREFEATELTPDALAAAYWLMQPEKHLAAMVVSQERMQANGMWHFFHDHTDVKEIFNMSYPNSPEDHDVIRKFARAVASGIFYARMKKELDEQSPAKPNERWEKARKAWYDEVTMLRSAAKPAAFFERAMILVEQGHRENGGVGTSDRGEAFDPSAVFDSISEDDFETFKVLFRMYLVQESTMRTSEPQNSLGGAAGSEGGKST